jgi:hypothetical protein
MVVAIQIDHISLPEFGVPESCPDLSKELYVTRIDRLRSRAFEVGIEVIVVYGDREHFANIAYLCGVDPRFEEALLVLSANRDPAFVTGPENQGYASISPLDLDLYLYPPLGLLGQNRSATPDLGDLLRRVGLRYGVTTGVIGWKYFTSPETEHPPAEAGGINRNS